MDSNIANEKPKGIRAVISVAGLVVVIIGMVFSVQTENALVPAVMMILGTIVILIAEKTTLDER
ncbi:MAG: hypothetical protein GQ583_07285 [Methyloprofundus sp.]|nr:hypothetical protein [Methyloprofundus sp.]